MNCEYTLWHASAFMLTLFVGMVVQFYIDRLMRWREMEEDHKAYLETSAALNEEVDRRERAERAVADLGATLATERSAKANGGDFPVYGLKSTTMPKAPQVSVSTKDKSYLVFHRGLWYVFERDA